MADRRSRVSIEVIVMRRMVKPFGVLVAMGLCCGGYYVANGIVDSLNQDACRMQMRVIGEVYQQFCREHGGIPPTKDELGKEMARCNARMVCPGERAHVSGEGLRRTRRPDAELIGTYYYVGSHPIHCDPKKAVIAFELWGQHGARGTNIVLDDGTVETLDQAGYQHVIEGKTGWAQTNKKGE
jgi:hypothetical protein